MGVADHSGATGRNGAPVSDYDPYTDHAILDPWPGYDMLRDMGPAVWLEKYDMYALTRYDSALRALRDDKNFISSKGVMMNDEMNKVLIGNTLCSDGERHEQLRKVVMRPVMPHALKSLENEIKEEAAKVVERLCAQREFDAFGELATYLPLTIVSNAVGLPAEGRERMLVWSTDMFNVFGPMNDRAKRSLPVLDEMMNYARTQAVLGKLKPGSWAEAIHIAAVNEEVPKEAVSVMMIDYMGPSLDTTIFAIANGVWQFANNPVQWEKLCADHSLVVSAMNEFVRMDAPIQDFSRYVTNDYDMDGVTLAKDSRAIVFYGAANRDPRRFEEPDRFDITRANAGTHLSFGAGPHMCLGMNLAKLEMRCLFTELAKRVKRFTIIEEHRALHNILRGFDKLIVSVDLH